MHICADEVGAFLVAVPALRVAYVWLKPRLVGSLLAIVLLVNVFRKGA